jgi:hypothetical protein
LLSRKPHPLNPKIINLNANAPNSIIYGYFEIAAKEGDAAGLKGMIMG